ncbi:MAG: response regulator transcription factor [Chloroflexota bacterium]
MSDPVAVVVFSALTTVRAGLAALLASDPGLQVVGEASDLNGRALASLDDDTDVVLLDAASAESIDNTVAMLEGLGPGLVVLGPTDAAGSLALSRPSFAWAFLPRDAGRERIVAALHAVAAGLIVLDPELSEQTLGNRVAGPLPDRGDPDDLTTREREVLTLVAIGLTNKAISQRLSISDHTVKFHVAAILAKLGAESRTEAVHLAARRGLLTL